MSRTINGIIPDNVVSEPDTNTGKRKKLINSNELFLEKRINKNFSLVIKQPNFFSALSSLLPKHFKCFAIIRNPLAVLLSWNSVDMAVASGRSPGVESFDFEISSILEKESNKYMRQVELIAWFFDSYLANLEYNNIIKYEDIIKSNGRSLLALHEGAKLINEELTSRNNNHFYDLSLGQELFELLIYRNGGYFKFYTKSDLRSILVAD